MDRLSSVVVAGGRSRRFDDREKALVPVGDAPMLARVAAAVAPVPGDLVINCRREQHEGFRTALDEANLPCSVRFAFDRTPDRGPLAGLRTGLELAAGETAVVVAGDLPLLDDGLVTGLLGVHRSTAGEATVPRVDGYPRPLCAVYDVEPTIAAIDDRLDGDRRRLRDLLAALDVTSVDRETISRWTDPDRLLSVDDPDDLRWARRYLRSAGEGHHDDDEDGSGR